MDGYGGIDGCAITLHLKYDVYVCFDRTLLLVLLSSGMLLYCYVLVPKYYISR